MPSKIDPATPKDCKITFASVLSRHGARDPTTKRGDMYREVMDRIHRSVEKYGTGVEFIKDYKYDLGAEELTFYGEQELVKSGIAFSNRYSALAQPNRAFFRAAGSHRVMESAKYFVQGFYESQGEKGEKYMGDILEIPEKEGVNNTLDHGGCPKFDNGRYTGLGREKQDEWRDVWATATQTRLNHKLPGADLSLDDTISLMDLCPFGTIATSNATLSQFCRLFSEDEWRSYDYYQSLEKWYDHGLGNPMGPTQGVGYVNELIARLTGEAVDDETSTNSTLDLSPKTFPLDRKLYADFSHDNMMVSIFAAMGLHNGTADLPTKYKLPPQKTNGFSSAWVVPFAARMYVEKMVCGEARAEEEELVRVLLNDRVVPLQNCNADAQGRCRLSKFVESLSFARGGGFWQDCFT